MNIRSLMFAVLGLFISIGGMSYWVASDLRRIHKEEAAQRQNSQIQSTNQAQMTDPNTQNQQNSDPYAQVPSESATASESSTYSESASSSNAGTILMNASKEIESCGAADPAGSYMDCTTQIPDVFVEHSSPTEYALSTKDATGMTYRYTHGANGDCRSTDANTQCGAW